jgi:hypothetical protein
MGEKRGNTCEVNLRQAVVGGKADTACIDEVRRSAGLLIGHMNPVRRFASFHYVACLLLLFWLLPVTSVLGDAEIGYFRLCSHVCYSLTERFDQHHSLPTAAEPLCCSPCSTNKNDDQSKLCLSVLLFSINKYALHV